MSCVETSIEYLAKIPLYDYEKPFLALTRLEDGHDPDEERLSNLAYETHVVRITDIRSCNHFRIDEAGFEVLKHPKSIENLKDIQGMHNYKSDTEQLLTSFFKAVKVICWDFRIRQNVLLQRSFFDINDPLLVEGPAKGAHSDWYEFYLSLSKCPAEYHLDATYDSGPQIIKRHLSEEDRARYLNPKFRFRIVNTWRPTIEKLQDRPLALCDYRSTSPRDLVAGDRVYPDRVGEVYYLQHNNDQNWYWLSDQNSDELFVMLMYETASGTRARYCPHVSFDNPTASPMAPARESVETRSIIITETLV